MAANILSAITAVICIIIYFVDLIFPWRYRHTNVITGILLIFSLLQLIVSLVISGFACKATCSNEPTLNVINVVPNHDQYVPVARSFPAYEAGAGISGVNGAPMNRTPEESPPAYSELKSESDN